MQFAGGCTFGILFDVAYGDICFIASPLSDLE